MAPSKLWTWTTSEQTQVITVHPHTHTNRLYDILLNTDWTSIWQYILDQLFWLLLLIICHWNVVLRWGFNRWCRQSSDETELLFYYLLLVTVTENAENLFSMLHFFFLGLAFWEPVFVFFVCDRPGVPKHWSHLEQEDKHGSCHQNHWRKHSRGKTQRMFLMLVEM